MFNVKANKKLVQQHTFISKEKVVTLKDLQKIANCDKDKINAANINTLVGEMKKLMVRVILLCHSSGVTLHYL